MMLVGRTILFCYLLISKVVQARWTLEVLVHHYSNKYSHALSNYNSGLCCDGSSSNNVCTNECETMFRFCVQPYNHGYNATRSGVCPYGDYDTGVVGGDEIDFQPYARHELSPGVPNPMTFGGADWPSAGARMYITVFDDDGSNGDEIVAISWLLLLAGPNSNSSNMFSEVKTLDFPPLDITIDVSYRLLCSKNYYGVNCTVFCEARDDTSGHYTCDTQGNIVCNNGYIGTNTNCTTRQCSNGYTGLYCEDKIILTSSDAVVLPTIAVITNDTSNYGVILGVSFALTIAVIVAVILILIVVLLLVMKRRHARTGKAEIANPDYNSTQSMGLSGDYYSVTDDLLSNNGNNFENPTYGCETESKATTLDTHSLGINSEYSLATSPAIVDDVVYSTAQNKRKSDTVYYSELTNSVYYSQPIEPEVVYYSEPTDPQETPTPAGQESVYYSSPPNTEPQTDSQAKNSSDGAPIAIYSSIPTDDCDSFEDSGEYACASNGSTLMTGSGNSLSLASGHYEMDAKFLNTQESVHFYHEVRNTI